MSSNVSLQSHRRRKSSISPARAASGPSNSIIGSSHDLDSSTPHSSHASHSSHYHHQHHHSAIEPSTSTGIAATEPLLEDMSASDSDLHHDEEMGLSEESRRKRRRKQLRTMHLDQRLVRDPEISTEEKKEADQSVLHHIAINVSLILLWYLFSLSISLYNKWMFDAEHFNFPFPLFVTSAHMLVQFVLSLLVLYFFPSLRPANALPPALRNDPTRPPIMSAKFFLGRIAPCGLATSFDIGFGNMSLQFITLTFYTFVLLFAILFRLERPSLTIVLIISTMTLGVVMMVAGEVEFSFLGFALVISASFFSGFRWALTQILLIRNPATSNPFSSIFFLAPVMFISLLLLAIPVEGLGPLMEGLAKLTEVWGYTTVGFLLFPGCIAFCMIASEFALLQRTSAVTLSIAGIFKEVLTISAAAFFFQDRLTLINFVGLITTMAAIVAYNYIKIMSMREKAAQEVHQTHVLHGGHFDGELMETEPLSPSTNHKDLAARHHHSSAPITSSSSSSSNPSSGLNSSRVSRRPSPDISVTDVDGGVVVDDGYHNDQDLGDDGHDAGDEDEDHERVGLLRHAKGSRSSTPSSSSRKTGTLSATSSDAPRSTQRRSKS